MAKTPPSQGKGDRRRVGNEQAYRTNWDVIFSKPRKAKLTPPKSASSDLFVVRLYDGFDNLWIDVSEPVTRAQAQVIWDEKTEKGTKKATYDDIDYYAIFAADTKMIYS